MTVSCKRNSRWLTLVLESLRCNGFAVVTDVLSKAQLKEISSAMYRVADKIEEIVGKERLVQAGEVGVLRLMLKYEPVFLSLLETPEMLAVVDHTVSETAILHLQNGFIWPSTNEGETPHVFQSQFHTDFKRTFNGYVASVNTFFPITDFSRESGGTVVVPGSHQRTERPDAAFIEATAVPVECPAGSMIAFDSTLWHAAGCNISRRDRLGINHQFCRSFFKQQIDYVRALGQARIEALPPRTQQLLGWYTRVVTSLDEYYRPPDERLYRAGQG